MWLYFSLPGTSKESVHVYIRLSVCLRACVFGYVYVHLCAYVGACRWSMILMLSFWRRPHLHQEICVGHLIYHHHHLSSYADVTKFSHFTLILYLPHPIQPLSSPPSLPCIPLLPSCSVCIFDMLRPRFAGSAPG